jgi:hypothetical protein
MKARLLAAEKSDQDLLEVLKPVIGDNKSPWQPYALMEAATYSANTRQDYTAARDYLKQVMETPDLPQSLYGKAKALDQIYSEKQPEKTDSKT